VKNPRILIVDDDEAMTQLIADTLAKKDFDPVYTTSPQKALDIIAHEDVDVVITDLNMQDINGLQLCEEVVKCAPDIPVVLITAFGSMESAIGAIHAGAHDYITKPFEMPHLVHVVQRAVEHRALRAEVKRLQDAVGRESLSLEMIGESQAINDVRSLVHRLADTDVTVLIYGESGTGKELVARALHAESRRKDGPFVAFNCAAIPENLIESELFGHAKGAFTGATSTNPGLLQQANGGTLFLDEIGEMPLEMQAKLLRALQEHKVRPVGSSKEVGFDARILSATQRDLEQEVQKDRFREDLLFRINVVRIDVPPLRSRGNDILLLAQTFLKEAANSTDRKVTGISPEAAVKIMSYDWPGNIRELQNAMQRAAALTRFEQIIIDDLPEKVQTHTSARISFDTDDLSSLITLEELEKRYVLGVLHAVGGNKTAAARILGFDRRTLYRKLERFNVDIDDPLSSLSRPSWPV